MLLMDGDGDGDGDMLFMDEGVLLVEGDEDGMFMFMGEPPRPMLWWIAAANP
jgi:hypothetical protein